MATDLVSEITGVVSEEISSRIAASLGVDKATVQQAVNAVVPTLLAALMSYVSKPGAAAKLNQVVAKQEPGMLSSSQRHRRAWAKGFGRSRCQRSYFPVRRQDVFGSYRRRRPIRGHRRAGFENIDGSSWTRCARRPRTATTRKRS